MSRHSLKYFGDLKWSLKTKMPVVRPVQSIKAKILSSSRVLQAIDYEVDQLIEKKNISADKARKEAKVLAEKIINDLVGEVKVSVMRSMAYTLHKAFKNLFEKITINMDML